MRTKVRRFLTDEFFWERPFTDDESLARSGLVDSMGVMELVAFVEKQGVQVEDNEITPDNFDSVDGIVDFIKRKRL